MHHEDIYKNALALKRNGLKIKQIHEITGVAKSTLTDWFTGKVRNSPINIHDPIDTLLHSFDGKARNKAIDAYSYTLGFYFSRGHIYKNKRTYELSFHVSSKRISKFKDAFQYLFGKDIKIKMDRTVSIYGKNLEALYGHEKEIQLWQTNILVLPMFFKGMVDAFDCDDERYVFKTNNEKIQFMFRGCCTQFGIKFSETECGKTEITKKFSLGRIKKILLDSWEDSF